MKRVIGLIGEDPNDTDSIAHLLRKIFPGVSCKPLATNFRGHHLDSEKFAKHIQYRLKDTEADLIVFIRDADCGPNEENIAKRLEWFQQHSRLTTRPTVFLLNIQELEALIFANLEAFNRKYHTAIKKPGDVRYINKPKEELKRLTAQKKTQYQPSHAPEVFALLDPAIIKKNCAYFSKFVEDLDQHLNRH